jgi:hypothetical protein
LYSAMSKILIHLMCSPRPLNLPNVLRLTCKVIGYLIKGRKLRIQCLFIWRFIEKLWTKWLSQCCYVHTYQRCYQEHKTRYKPLHLILSG